MNTTAQIEDIKGMLTKLSYNTIIEARDFVAFLLEKERKKKAFEARVLKAEQEPTMRFDTVSEAMKSILDETAD